MTSTTVPTSRARSDRLYTVVMAVLLGAAALCAALTVWSAWSMLTGTPDATVGLIPAACASVDPVKFPCALPSMAVRW